MRSRSARTSSGLVVSIRSSRNVDGCAPTISQRETAPSCVCGCGLPTKWNERRKRWGAYLFGHSRSPLASRYSKTVKVLRSVEAFPEAPDCRCGCGQPVHLHPHGARRYWADYLRHHQVRGRSIHSATTRERAAARMRADNPMRRPGVAKAVGEKARGRPLKLSPEVRARLSEMARVRMKSDRNPMKDDVIRNDVLQRVLSRVRSKNEQHFEDWAKANGMELSAVGGGTFWIGRRNPDFRVPGQKKVIEVTQRTCFAGGQRVRTVETYGAPTISHYSSKGWSCLVIFKRDHRCIIPSSLIPVLNDYLSKESNWSGIWNFDRLIRSSA